jgi:YD repeat-containing protein
VRTIRGSSSIREGPRSGRSSFARDSNNYEIDYGNGAKTTSTFDYADRLMSTSHALTASTINLNYTRAANSVLTGDGTNNYGYDAMNRVTLANTASYTYDAADEFTQKAVSGGNTTTLTYDPANEIKSLTVMNGVTQVSKLTYAYDSDGNRIRSIDQNNFNTTYGYDQANRMVAFNGPSSSSTYTYNGDGLLTQSVSGGASTQLIWNTEPSLPLLIETGSTSIINGPDGLPEEQLTSGGTRYYYHQDQIGSTLALSDPSGTQVQSYAYDPYGNLTSSSGSITNPFQFQGQYLDATSAVYYMRARLVRSEHWPAPLARSGKQMDARELRLCYG